MIVVSYVQYCIFRQLKNLSVNQIDAETVRQKMEEMSLLQNNHADASSGLRSNRLLVPTQYYVFVKNEFWFVLRDSFDFCWCFLFQQGKRLVTQALFYFVKDHSSQWSRHGITSTTSGSSRPWKRNYPFYLYWRSKFHDVRDFHQDT